MWNPFRKRTTEEQRLELQCKIASMEKELEALWKFEKARGYVTGNRDEIIDITKKLAYKQKQLELLNPILDEFQLIDRLATMLGIAAPESQEERNISSVYQRRVLRAAIKALEQAWQK